MSGRRAALIGTILAGVLALAAAVRWHPWKVESTSDPPVERTPTFSRDVAPIIFAKCSQCHRPGESAPFDLLAYEDVRSRSGQIVEVTGARIMPPWLPTEGHGDFENARRLGEGELRTLKRWVEAGMPRGDDSEAPAPPSFAEGWQAGPPDLILESPAYALDGSDRDVFRNFVVPVPLPAPRWVRSIELRPDNPRVTHHARLGVDSSNESVRRDAEDPEPGYAGMSWAQDPDGQLVVWAPGLVAPPGKPGVAWRLFPKTCLVLHTHMQPSGKPEIVRFRIGIRFAEDAPALRPAILRIGSCDIDIPAGAARHTASDVYTLPIDVEVHSIFPHAHSLCREVNVVAERPDGSREPLLAIDRFDEKWHGSYHYRQPERLPRGTRLVTTFAYDNSEANPRNRHRPPRRTVYGSNADDEMADVYLQVTAAHADQRAALMEDYKRYDLKSQRAGFRKSLEQDPENPWSLEGLATCCFGLGDVGEAMAILERRLKNGPKAVYPVVSLGMARLAGGDAAKAETQFRLATTMDGEYPLAWFGLGKALAVQRKSEPAEQAFRRAVELAPGSVEAHLELATLLLQRGELEKAASVCSAALGDSPDMASILLKQAEISAKRQRYDESLEYCRQACSLAPYTHPPKVLLAVFCFANGERDRALGLLQEARRDSPAHPMPHLMLGQYARRQQQWDAARSYLAVAALQPLPENWPESHRRRYLVLLHSERFQLAQSIGDLELARTSLAQWMECEPGNDQLKKLAAELPPRKAQ